MESSSQDSTTQIIPGVKTVQINLKLSILGSKLRTLKYKILNKLNILCSFCCDLSHWDPTGGG